jgi:hypothetical protein
LCIYSRSLVLSMKYYTIVFIQDIAQVVEWSVVLEIGSSVEIRKDCE